MLLFLLIALVNISRISECRRGPHHPREEPLPPGIHPHSHPTGYKLTQDEALIHDKTHIQEDIGQPLENMTDEELEFYYFKLHDFDGNAHLDGLEMLKAIFHTADHEHDETETETVPDTEEILNQYIAIIDNVLNEDDLNNDGLISYPEFITGKSSGKPINLPQKSTLDF